MMKLSTFQHHDREIIWQVRIGLPPREVVFLAPRLSSDPTSDMTMLLSSSSDLLLMMKEPGNSVLSSLSSRRTERGTLICQI